MFTNFPKFSKIITLKKFTCKLVTLVTTFLNKNYKRLRNKLFKIIIIRILTSNSYLIINSNLNYFSSNYRNLFAVETMDSCHNSRQVASQSYEQLEVYSSYTGGIRTFPIRCLGSA